MKANKEQPLKKQIIQSKNKPSDLDERKIAIELSEKYSEDLLKIEEQLLKNIEQLRELYKNK